MRAFLFTTILSLFIATTTFAQTSPAAKVRSNDSFTQVDNYLVALKRLGIPTTTTDNLSATSTAQNSIKIFYNRTLNKLRKYDPVTSTYGDLFSVDLSAYYTASQVDNLFSSYAPTWASITGKPSAFTPSAHTHPWSDVTGKPTTVAGYGITDSFQIGFVEPSSATDTGVKGEIRVTDTHIYVCIDTNVWVRAELNTW